MFAKISCSVLLVTLALANNPTALGSTDSVNQLHPVRDEHLLYHSDSGVATELHKDSGSLVRDIHWRQDTLGSSGQTGLASSIPVGMLTLREYTNITNPYHHANVTDSDEELRKYGKLRFHQPQQYQILLTASNGVHGNELHITDGTSTDGKVRSGNEISLHREYCTDTTKGEWNCNQGCDFDVTKTSESTCLGACSDGSSLKSGCVSTCSDPTYVCHGDPHVLTEEQCYQGCTDKLILSKKQCFSSCEDAGVTRCSDFTKETEAECVSECKGAGDVAGLTAATCISFCSNAMFQDEISCETAGATWTARDYFERTWIVVNPEFHDGSTPTYGIAQCAAAGLKWTEREWVDRRWGPRDSPELCVPGCSDGTLAPDGTPKFNDDATCKSSCIQFTPSCTSDLYLSRNTCEDAGQVWKTYTDLGYMTPTECFRDQMNPPQMHMSRQWIPRVWTDRTWEPTWNPREWRPSMFLKEGNWCSDTSKICHFDVQMNTEETCKAFCSDCPHGICDGEMKPKLEHECLEPLIWTPARWDYRDEANCQSQCRAADAGTYGSVDSLIQNEDQCNRATKYWVHREWHTENDPGMAAVMCEADEDKPYDVVCPLGEQIDESQRFEIIQVSIDTTEYATTGAHSRIQALESDKVDGNPLPGPQKRWGKTMDYGESMTDTDDQEAWYGPNERDDGANMIARRYDIGSNKHAHQVYSFHEQIDPNLKVDFAYRPFEDESHGMNVNDWPRGSIDDGQQLRDGKKVMIPLTEYLPVPTGTPIHYGANIVLKTGLGFITDGGAEDHGYETEFQNLAPGTTNLNHPTWRASAPKIVSSGKLGNDTHEVIWTIRNHQNFNDQSVVREADYVMFEASFRREMYISTRNVYRRVNREVPLFMMVNGDGTLGLTADPTDTRCRFLLRPHMFQGTKMIKDIQKGIDVNNVALDGIVQPDAEISDHFGDNFPLMGSKMYTDVCDTKQDNQALFEKDLLATTDPGDKFTRIAYFSADDGRSGREMWSTDGTMFGTSMVADINKGRLGNDLAASSDVNHVTVYSKYVIFSATGHRYPFKPAAIGHHDTAERELYVHDTVTKTTKLLNDINTGGSSNPQDFTQFKNKLYFTAHGANCDDRVKVCHVENKLTAGAVVDYSKNEAQCVSSCSVAAANEHLCEDGGEVWTIRTWRERANIVGGGNTCVSDCTDPLIGTMDQCVSTCSEAAGCTEDDVSRKTVQGRCSAALCAAAGGTFTERTWRPREWIDTGRELWVTDGTTTRTGCTCASSTTTPSGNNSMNRTRITITTMQ